MWVNDRSAVVSCRRLSGDEALVAANVTNQQDPREWSTRFTCFFMWNSQANCSSCLQGRCWARLTVGAYLWWCLPGLHPSPPSPEETPASSSAQRSDPPAAVWASHPPETVSDARVSFSVRVCVCKNDSAECETESSITFYVRQQFHTVLSHLGHVNVLTSCWLLINKHWANTTAVNSSLHNWAFWKVLKPEGSLTCLFTKRGGDGAKRGNFI